MRVRVRVCLSKASAGKMRQTLQIFCWLGDSVSGAKPPRLTLVNHAQEQSNSSRSSPLNAFTVYRFLYVIPKSRSRQQIASCCCVFLLSSIVFCFDTRTETKTPFFCFVFVSTDLFRYLTHNKNSNCICLRSVKTQTMRCIVFL